MSKQDENQRKLFVVANEIIDTARSAVHRLGSPEQKAQACMRAAMNNPSRISEDDLTTALLQDLGYHDLYDFIEREWNKVMEEFSQRWKGIIHKRAA